MCAHAHLIMWSRSKDRAKDRPGKAQIEKKHLKSIFYVIFLLLRSGFSHNFHVYFSGITSHCTLCSKCSFVILNLDSIYNHIKPARQHSSGIICLVLKQRKSKECNLLALCYRSTSLKSSVIVFYVAREPFVSFPLTCVCMQKHANWMLIVNLHWSIKCVLYIEPRFQVLAAEQFR